MATAVLASRCRIFDIWKERNVMGKGNIGRKRDCAEKRHWVEEGNKVDKYPKKRKTTKRSLRISKNTYDKRFENQGLIQDRHPTHL